MGKKKRSEKQGKIIYGRLRPQDLGLLVAENIGISLMVSWVFYDCIPAALLLMVPVSFINGSRFFSSKRSEFETGFMGEYKVLLRNLVAGLEAGYSVENAFKQAERIHTKMYGESSVLSGEIRKINSAVDLRMPVESAFMEFAVRYPYEEVLGFANIFSLGKRLGGSYVENLRRTAKKLEEKVELKADIRTMIAQKELELNVMCVMPVAIIVYMRLGSPGFLDPLYRNAAGVIFMTICCALYAAAMYIGRKLVTIEV